MACRLSIVGPSLWLANRLRESSSRGSNPRFLLAQSGTFPKWFNYATTGMFFYITILNLQVKSKYTFPTRKRYRRKIINGFLRPKNLWWLFHNTSRLGGRWFYTSFVTVHGGKVWAWWVLPQNREENSILGYF